MKQSDNKPSICESCGAEVPPHAPGGMCPQCLLKQGLSGMTAHNAAECRFFEPPSLETMKKKFPQLEILEFLGRGGMGAVYKARQPRLNRIVAIKVLLVDPDSHPEFSQRFIREAQVLARLSHPHIVTIYDVGEEDGLYYFIMEFVDGETLKDVLAVNLIPPEKAIAITTDVCGALQYAHEHGVIHRDIKPGNILVDKAGRIKVVDFGLAKIMASGAPDVSLTMTNQSMGTPYYMAPEQRDATRDVDHRADIYSLGVVLYEMLTGEIPVGSFEPVSKKIKVVPHIDEIIFRALKMNPDLRYQHVSGLSIELEEIASAGMVPIIQKRKILPTMVVAILAILALFVSLSTFWGFFKKRQATMPQDVAEFGGNYYKVYYENLDWHEARRQCERMGGYLAVVNSQAEDEFLATISRSHVWLGATDEHNEGAWVWVDGTKLTYSNWDNAEPNNTKDSETGERENYLMVSKYAKWNDLPLNSRVIKGFICEWDGAKHPCPKKITTAADLHAALQKANYAYNGKGIVDIKDGVIIGLILVHTGITDLSPLRGLALSSLNISWANVTDLSPLENMPLTTLEMTRSKVEDISSLAGMSLTELRIDGTRVKDLSPLKGMSLVYLDINHTRVTDLSPLAGMPLEELHMNSVKITDLAPLAGMPLKIIGLLDTPVTDLSPLEKCLSLESVIAPDGITPH